MSKVIKIDKSDIKEMVQSCLGNLLKEGVDIANQQLYAYDLFYIGADQGYGTCYYLTDNLDFASKKLINDDRVPIYYLSYPDVSTENFKTLDLGEGDFSDMPRDEIANYIINGTYDMIVFYPDNKTTCVICTDRPIKIRPYHYVGNREYNIQNFDLSSLEVSLPHTTDNKDFTCECYDGVITCFNKKERVRRDVGYVKAYKIGAYFEGDYSGPEGENKKAEKYKKALFSTLDRGLRMPDESVSSARAMVKHFDLNKPSCYINFSILERYRRTGMGSIALKKIMDFFNDDCNYFVICSINHDKTTGIDKVLRRAGFNLIYYNDMRGLYLKNE